MRTALACYSLAVLAVLATALLKGPIEAHLGHGPPFILWLMERKWWSDHRNPLAVRVPETAAVERQNPVRGGFPP